MISSMKTVAAYLITDSKVARSHLAATIRLRPFFKQLRAERTLTATEGEQWMTYIMQHVARWNAARDWTMQLTHRADPQTRTRKCSSASAPTLATTPCSTSQLSVNSQASSIVLAIDDALPKTIFYHINPAYFYSLATLMGSYQDGRVAGKMQLGSGWWHADTLDGMRTQIEVLSSVGLLSKFVGMLTDSRSFLSFPRHEYFRRLLCGIIGNDVEAGLIPDDAELLDQLVADICFGNAQRYFNFPGV